MRMIDKILLQRYEICVKLTNIMLEKLQILWEQTSEQVDE